MRAVQDALPGRTDDGAGTLPVDAEAFMVAHSGISMSDEAIAVAGQRLAARRIAEAAQTLDTAAVAALLGVHRTRVQHLRNDGGLFAYRDGRFNRYPLWQFTDHARPLPGLRQVLAALGPTHRSVVTGFMASAHPELDTGAGPVSARDWLAEAGEQQDRLPVDDLDQGDLQLAEALAGTAEWRAEVPLMKVGRPGMSDDAAIVAGTGGGPGSDQHVPRFRRGRRRPRGRGTRRRPVVGCQGFRTTGDRLSEPGCQGRR